MPGGGGGGGGGGRADEAPGGGGGTLVGIEIGPESGEPAVRLVTRDGGGKGACPALDGGGGGASGAPAARLGGGGGNPGTAIPNKVLFAGGGGGAGARFAPAGMLGRLFLVRPSKISKSDPPFWLIRCVLLIVHG